jgi:hydrogenase maturation protease
MRTLVAGVGNIFLRDDGFGVEVAHRLLAGPLPDGVKVVDYGIRGLHLAYELLDGYEELVIVDALPRGGAPGTVYVFEPAAGDDAAEPPPMDGHDMTPQAVLSLVRAMGGTLGGVVVVGCEPADVTDGMGLSAPVAAAVDEAVHAVHDLISKHERV